HPRSRILLSFPGPTRCPAAHGPAMEEAADPPVRTPHLATAAPPHAPRTIPAGVLIRLSNCGHPVLVKTLCRLPPVLRAEHPWLRGRSGCRCWRARSRSARVPARTAGCRRRTSRSTTGASGAAALERPADTPAREAAARRRWARAAWRDRPAAMPAWAARPEAAATLQRAAPRAPVAPPA